MVRKSGSIRRREESLSRDRVIEASIELLDSDGERGLTFRALSERLATGPGAIYWHIDNKSDLLIAACDAVIAPTVEASLFSETPKAAIRNIASGIFDAIDAHPWLGSALILSAGQLPMVRILERIGRQVRALGVPDEEQWTVVSVLLNYILGVGGQNAANAQFARTRSLNRHDFLEAVSTCWSQFDPLEYPFTHQMATQLRAHDDREQFLAGIDLILAGIENVR